MLTAAFYNRNFTGRVEVPIPLSVDRYSHHMLGGPEKAYLSCPAHADMWELLKLLRCPVEIYGGDGRLNWWGYVNRVSIPRGEQRVGMGLDMLANYVTVKYNGGITAAASDPVSIAEYGQKEVAYSDSGADATQGVQTRDLYLKEHQYAHPEIEFTSADTVEIECYGWYETLDWKYYDDTTDGNLENTTQISQIVTDAGQFFIGSNIENTAGITSNEKRDGSRTALDYINELLDGGTTNIRPLLATVDGQRFLHVWERPAEPPEGVAPYSLNKDGDLLTQTDDVVPPEWCICAKWMQIKDVPISAKSAASLHSVFIEHSEYKADVDKTVYKLAGAYDQNRLAKYIAKSNGYNSTDPTGSLPPAGAGLQVVMAAFGLAASVATGATGTCTPQAHSYSSIFDSSDFSLSGDNIVCARDGLYRYTIRLPALPADGSWSVGLTGFSDAGPVEYAAFPPAVHGLTGYCYIGAGGYLSVYLTNNSGSTIILSASSSFIVFELIGDGPPPYTYPISGELVSSGGYSPGGGGGGVTDHGALTGLLDDDHPQYVKHDLSTAGNDFLVGSGSNTWIKKTLAEAQTILGVGAGGGHTIQEEGTPLTQRTNLNFVGAQITATDSASADATVVTVDAAPSAKGVTNGDSHDHNGGDGAAIVEAAITLADNTTNDASSTKHGFLKKLDGSANHFIGGDGAWHPITEQDAALLIDAAGEVAGYKRLTLDRGIGFGATVAVACATADTPIEEWVLDAGDMTPLLADQVVHIHIHAAKTAGSKDATLYAELYHSGGGETLLGTTTATGAIPGTETEYDLTILLGTDYGFSASERLVVKFLGSPSGAGTDPTITLYYDGATQSRVGFTGNPGNLETYVRHDLATAASDFLVASGVGVFVKKTLAEVKALLGIVGTSREVLAAARTYYVRVEVGSCTTSIASPCVVHKVGHGLSINDPVVFRTTGALPTGLTAGTIYYIISAGFGVDDFEISTSLGGAAVNTSGTQSGTHYVATGNDSNDGSAADRAHALLTIQHAIDTACALDLSIYAVTIQCADSFYEDPLSLHAYPGGTAIGITISGNTTTPANCTIHATGNHAVNSDNFAGIWSIEGFKLYTTTAGSAIIASVGTYIRITGNMEYGAIGTYSHLVAYGTIQILANYTISGPAGIHYQANTGGVITAYGITVTITGTPAFIYFAYCYNVSYLEIAALTFSGSATGGRYYAGLNGVINTNGGGANYFPGNAPGTSATGGQYA